MKREIFREKSLERLNSADDFDKYVKVSRPTTWILVLGILFVLTGFLIWGIFGHLPTYIQVGILKQQNGRNYCLIKEEDMEEVQEGMQVESEGQYFTISNLSNLNMYVSVDELTMYDLQKIGFDSTKWVYFADVSGAPEDDDDGIFIGKILVNDVNPISFILN